MNWREWPKGAENAEYTGIYDQCPVCSTALRPVEVFCISRPEYYGQEETSYYTALCPKCRTQYIRAAPRSKVIISPDAEAITELEERVITLEQTLSKLITYIHAVQQREPTKQIPAQRQEAQDDTEDFTRRYRHLL